MSQKEDLNIILTHNMPQWELSMKNKRENRKGRMENVSVFVCL
jgi:hypothetical protein